MAMFTVGDVLHALDNDDYDGQMSENSDDDFEGYVDENEMQDTWMEDEHGREEEENDSGDRDVSV